MEALALKFPLSEAQEIIALDAGYASWAELKTGLAVAPKRAKPALSARELKGCQAGDIRHERADLGGLLSRQAPLRD